VKTPNNDNNDKMTVVIAATAAATAIADYHNATQVLCSHLI